MLARGRSTKSSTARIPKSCRPCARAKARCEINAGENICKRCHRLQKVCEEQSAGAHRRSLGKAQTNSRGKADRDVYRRQKAPRSSSIADVLDARPSPEHSPASLLDSFVRSEHEADALLCIFRDEMVPLFPFVVIAPNDTFSVLKEQKPYLSFAVVMVACRHDSARQMAIAEAFHHLICHNMILAGAKTIDLLQSILVFINWSHHHFPLGPHICNLIYLAKSLVVELKLHRDTPHKFLKPSNNDGEYFGKCLVASNINPIGERSCAISENIKTIEQRRTFLGVFFMTSIVSMCSRDVDPIPRSRHVEECCVALEESLEQESDAVVIYLVRIHALACRTANCLGISEAGCTAPFESAPIGALVSMFDSELQQLKRSFQLRFCQNDLFIMHCYAVEIYIYESAIGGSIVSSRYGSHPFNRLNMLYACLKATKSCFETAYTLRSSLWLHLPYHLWSLTGHAMVVLSRLCLLKAEGWDLAYIRSVMSFPDMINELQGKIEEARRSTLCDTGLAGSPLEIPERFGRLSIKLQHIKAAYEAKEVSEATLGTQILYPSSEGIIAETHNQEFLLPSSYSFFDFLEFEL